MILGKILRSYLSKVKVLESNSNNIHFNLATEEYLFEVAQLTEPTLFLWRNSPTIVIGRHQNPWKQCKNEEMKEKGVLLSRRKTGGGAVYHDLGNTCFSFLTPYSQGQEYNYKTVNNQIIIKTLKELGVEVHEQGRNDITFKGRKISGSAYRIHLGGRDGAGRKALHHGTVLFSVDLQAVQKYLNPNKKKLESKGVDSIISRVMNLNQSFPHLNHQIFCREIQKQFQQKYGASIQKELLDYETLKTSNPIINQNYERLKSWDWLYGECPEFKYSIDKKFTWGMTEITYNVVDGYIKEAKVYSDCLFPEFVQLVDDQIIKKVKYDRYGFTQLQQNLVSKLDMVLQPMARQLCDWMKQQL